MSSRIPLEGRSLGRTAAVRFLGVERTSPIRAMNTVIARVVPQVAIMVMKDIALDAMEDGVDALTIPENWKGVSLSLKKALMLRVSPLCFLVTLLYLKANFKISRDFTWVAVRPKPFSNVSFTEVRMEERQLSLLRDETGLTV